MADGYLTDIQQRLQTLSTPLPVEILLLRRSREQRLDSLHRLQQETLSELSVSEVFERRLALENTPDEPRRQRIRHLFDQVVNDLRTEHEAPDA
ncbi:exonuclease SbcCD subunit D C-terminal domain-containing protein [Sodalis glossinidius]|uniref:exonuclease SbcCD subunit D C-terminal domain-containing protein n=1 Tax=Sodalis glossinidius TaxID=63612 RepID=UPI0002DA1BC5